jgi:hypothetical protein
MNLQDLYQEIEVFSEGKHGSSDYYKESLFVRGNKENSYAPLKYLSKKDEKIKDKQSLYKEGFVCDSLDLYDQQDFLDWYEIIFGRKLKRSIAKTINIIYLPDNKSIFDAIELVNKSYEVLRSQHIIMNNKNLPVQLGEWYAKAIFGLEQSKSASQRGFDFYIDGKRVEIKVEWGDKSSQKGVKVRKSLVDLSEYCIIIYIARNFMIREICFLDSNFIIRKFSGKGHTIFLKDSDVNQYFFSASEKHTGKVANSSALLKYSTPQLAMKIAESF